MFNDHQPPMPSFAMGNNCLCQLPIASKASTKHSIYRRRDNKGILNQKLSVPNSFSQKHSLTLISVSKFLLGISRLVQFVHVADSTGVHSKTHANDGENTVRAYKHLLLMDVQK